MEIMFCRRCAAPCEPRQDGELIRQVCPACGWVLYENPAPCVSILVVDDLGRFLLGRRARTAIYPGRWCLPCGHVELTENFIEAAVRETREETGLEIEPVRIINVVTNHLGGGVHSLVVVLLARPLSGEIRPGDDIEEVRWVDLQAELSDMAFEADRHIINRYRQERDSFGLDLRDTIYEFFQAGPRWCRQ